jgi:uncharacterized protein
VPSLREIQKTIATFWINGEAREWLEDGADPSTTPDVVKPLDNNLLQSADAKGVGLYGRMISYGHHDVMDSIFPYCSQLLGDTWQEAVDDYLIHYPPDHYNLNKICRHFSEYLLKHGQQYLQRYPFLAELADYEWLELEKIDENLVITRGDDSGISTPDQIVTLGPIVNPTLTVRHYRYPIADIAAKLENGKKVRRKVPAKATHLAIYRDPESHRARFLELGAAAATIVETAHTENGNYQSLLQLAVSLTPELPPDQAVLDFLQLIEDLQTALLFTGSQRKE